MKPPKLIKELGLNPGLELEPMGDDFGADDPARLKEFEELLGKKLPEDYRQFLLRLAPCQFSVNAMFRALEPSTWADSETGLGDFGIFYGLAEDDSDDIIETHRDEEEELPPGMFIFGESDSGNFLMSLEKPAGRIYFQDRNTFEDLRKILYLCANSFTEFLKSFERVPDEPLSEDDGLIEDLDAYEKEEERKEREREKNDT